MVAPSRKHLLKKKIDELAKLGIHDKEELEKFEAENEDYAQKKFAEDTITPYDIEIKDYLSKLQDIKVLLSDLEQSLKPITEHEMNQIITEKTNLNKLDVQNVINY